MSHTCHVTADFPFFFQIILLRTFIHKFFSSLYYQTGGSWSQHIGVWIKWTSFWKHNFQFHALQRKVGLSIKLSLTTVPDKIDKKRHLIRPRLGAEATDVSVRRRIYASQCRNEWSANNEYIRTIARVCLTDRLLQHRRPDGAISVRWSPLSVFRWCFFSQRGRTPQHKNVYIYFMAKWFDYI